MLDLGMNTNNYYTLRQTFWGKSRDSFASFSMDNYLVLAILCKKVFASVLPSFSGKLNVLVEVRISKHLMEWINI